MKSSRRWTAIWEKPLNERTFLGWIERVFMGRSWIVSQMRMTNPIKWFPIPKLRALPHLLNFPLAIPVSVLQTLVSHEFRRKLSSRKGGCVCVASGSEALQPSDYSTRHSNMYLLLPLDDVRNGMSFRELDVAIKDDRIAHHRRQMFSVLGVTQSCETKNQIDFVSLSHSQ